MSDRPAFEPLALILDAHQGDPIDDVLAGVMLVATPIWIWFYILGWVCRWYKSRQR